MEELHKEQILSNRQQYEMTLESVKKEFNLEISEVKRVMEEKIQLLKEQLKV